MENQIYIIKRNGSKELLDISKIRKHTTEAVAGLSNVDLSELEASAPLRLRDGMESSKIQQILIQTALDKIDIDKPDWSFVAARLFLYDLYKRVTGTHKYDTLQEHFARLEKYNRVTVGLKDLYDLDKLNEVIDPSRDLQFNYMGIKTLHDKYIIKDYEGNPIELPQHLFMGVAMFLAQNEKDREARAIEFYNVLSKFEVMVATPTLSNARTLRHQLSSCYIGSMPDNIEGIFDSFKEMALLSKYGGGIGFDITQLRGIGASIDNNANAAGGVIPFTKILNGIVTAVDQLGTRKGAIAPYLEVWHTDIKEFVELKKNSGEERRRAHDLHPAIWIPDLFMERVNEDKEWTLFSPDTAKGLSEVYGDKFVELYTKYEQDPSIPKTTIKARDLWKDILRNYQETGAPFLGFKDAANRANPNPHLGVIRSSNLCTEIFQVTNPDYYTIEIKYEDGSIEEYEEQDIITIKDIRNDNNYTLPAKKITSIHTILSKEGIYKKVYQSCRKRNEGETAVCNLASINIAKVNTKEDIERVVPIVIRMLDNVIDLNFYPMEKVKNTNLTTRSIGLGSMNEACYLAEHKIHYGSQEHFNVINKIYEMISYNAIKASSELAVEKGKYDNFEGSNWSKGIFPHDHTPQAVLDLVDTSTHLDWDSLREQVKRDGMRNGYLMAIAPTSSISLVIGATSSCEPIYRKKWQEENASGQITCIVPNLNLDTYQYYTSAYDIDQVDLVKAASIRQRWYDQGQSTNIFIKFSANTSMRMIHNIYNTAWQLGLKSTYYLRSESPTTDQYERDNYIECHSCQ